MIKSPQDLAQRLTALAAICQSQISQIKSCGTGPAVGAPLSSELVFEAVRDELRSLASELQPSPPPPSLASILENARLDGFPV
jgi:hypothetical protein